METWKKIGIAVVVVVLIVLSFAVSSKGGGSDVSFSLDLSDDAEEILSNAQTQSDRIDDSDTKEPNQITVNQYLEYKAGSEATIILLARPTCGYCQIAEPIINFIAKEYDLTINYLNTDNFEGDDQTNFVQSDEVFSQGYGTPYLFIVKEGSIIDSVDGLTDYAHYVEFFKTNGFIK